MAKTKKEVAKTTGTEMAFVQEAEVPSYIKQGDACRGSENVTAEDLTIPRLEIIQDLSPCRKKQDPAYIEGAEEGMLYNNVTRELYTEGVLVIPVIFKKEFLIWKDRDNGGGFCGAFDTQEEANIEIQKLVAEGDAGPFEAVDTMQNLCLMLHVDESGKLVKVDEIAISMSRSKAKISRQWNSMIRINGGDRFSRVYKLSAVGEKNKKNQDFFNFHVMSMGFPPEDVYKAAETLYNDMESGAREMKVNTDTDDAKPEGTKEEF